MKQDEFKTEMIFRKEKNGDILAVFPYEPYNDIHNVVGCYAHLGQHGGCHFDYVLKETKPAKPEEYAALYKELESLGYNIKVVRRRNYQRYLTELKKLRA